MYGGVTYHSCTKVAHHREWCSLSLVYSGKWANCGKENPHDTKPVFHNFHMIVKVLLSKLEVAGMHLFHTAREGMMKGMI